MNTFLKDYLEHIIPVDFELECNGEVVRIGEGKPAFRVTFHKDIEQSELLTSTSLALGEAYMRKDLEVNRDLFEVLDLFMGQMGKFTINKGKLKKLIRTSKVKRNQQKEVRSHYDLGNEFYSLWLDETMSYSCGYFKEETDNLLQAQQNKVHHILEKLQIKPGMRLLDIGCGWGYLLKEAAKTYGIKGCGITLSKEQYKKFQNDIQKEGLQDQLDVKLIDYRDLRKSGMKFDRIVSVGMIEHVGRGNYGLFMENANAVLEEGGLFLLHYISAQKEHEGDAWIKKYIFPGGVIPSLREVMTVLPEYDFYTLDVESLRRHYMKTLLCWRENYLAHIDQIKEMQGEEFVRMWDLYLAACAATFHNGIVDLHQVLMSKGINNDLPMTRSV